MTDQLEEDIPDLNIFMMCRKLDGDAPGDLPDAYHVRNCREDELEIWKGMPFDDPVERKEYQAFMDDYFTSVYAHKGNLFFEVCLYVCDKDDHPIATAFIWKAYDEFNTIHWLKVLKEHEGKGIGRALLSILMRDLQPKDYPVYLHTQPGSYRAIKLYSDFGFELLSDPVVGTRSNDLDECLPILERFMLEEDFKRLKVARAPGHFLRKLERFRDEQF
jgi:ribosomal protein S18 acetylase RimI-like enzyme